MQEHTASPEQSQDESFVVRGPRPDGFTILYNDAASLLVREHSAVVKCYLALCLMSNGARASHPSLSTIGKMMGDMSVDSARRAVNRLEDLDLLLIHRPENQGRGTANTYMLTRPEGLQNKGGNGATHTEKGSNSKPEGLQDSPKRVAPAMPPQQVQNNQQNNQQTTSRARENEEEGWIDNRQFPEEREMGQIYGDGPIQHHPSQAVQANRQAAQNINRQAQESQRQTNSGVSNRNRTCQDGGVYGIDCPFDTLEEEKAHPYWTAANVEYFKALIEPYPQVRLGPQVNSMHAWRTVVGDLAEHQDWIDAWWKGLHDWKYKWDTERTLEKEGGKYVPFLANFIRKKKWEDVQQAPGR